MATTGMILDNKYEILTEIGRGGMSIVYLARDRRLNKQWAVKEVRKQSDGRKNQIVVQSLLAEAEMMKQLDHPLIPRIVDIIENDTTIYIVMDYMEGISLDRYLRENGPLPQEAVVHIGIQLCDALGYLHSRRPPIIYRDMKPANVMLKDPDKMDVQLFDFGIAREYKEGRTGDTILLGTPGFAAPEQCRRGKQTDARTDIFSLGVTLYNLVTGHGPTEDLKLYPIRHWNSRLSDGLEQIILKCTREEPDDRYNSCEELMYDLRRYKSLEAAYRKGLKRRLGMFLVPASLALVCLAGGFGFRALFNSKSVQNFETALLLGDRETDASRRQDYYLEAIGYDVSDIRGYEGLIDLYKQDSSFSTDERSVLQGQIQQNLKAIEERSLEDYVRLTYDIGTLYWFYYDYGNTSDNQTTRMVSALPWFTTVQEVCAANGYAFDKLEMTDLFCRIGSFYSEYATNIREAADMGTYLSFWNTLEEFQDYLRNNNEQELMEWESYKVIVYALENLMPKFKSDGVTRDQIETMIAAVRADTAALPATTDVTVSIRDYIGERLAENGGVARTFAANYGV